MIKLLIVDDEEEIRKGIRNIIDWEANSIQVCGEAENGKEAQKMIEELSPDVILVDIRMPVMNGLQLIETVKASGHKVKSIILSGYDDFEYAQGALKYGASDYLLKPCRPDEILKTVLKVKTDIENERQKKEVIDRLKIHFNQSLPVLKEKYLGKLLESERNLKGNIDENFALYKIGINCSSSVVIVIRIDNYFDFCLSRSNGDIELLKFAVKNITTELLSKRYSCEVFEYCDDIAAIINIDTDGGWENLVKQLDIVKANINNYLGFTVSIGVGNRCDELNSICKSYYEALKSIEAKFLVGSNVIIKFADINDESAAGLIYPLSEEKDILNSIKAGNQEEIFMRVGNFFSRLESVCTTKDNIVKCALALALSVYHLCIERNVETTSIFGQGFTFFDCIQRLDNIYQLKERINDVAEKTLSAINSKEGSNKFIEIAVKFIEKNYDKDLSLETVAREAYINPCYLSLLFKQNLGINFVDFLHKTRIEKACEMLKDVRMKTYEIASKVGFNDAKYFSQIFKKYTGITPSQYRENF